jgi:hypothetical protein
MEPNKNNMLGKLISSTETKFLNPEKNKHNLIQKRGICPKEVTCFPKLSQFCTKSVSTKTHLDDE